MKTIIQGALGGLTGMVLLMAMSAPAQNLFVSSFNSNSIDEIAPNGTVSTFVTGITDPTYMAFNGAGDLFVASLGTIDEITPGGVKSTFATGLVDIGGLTFNSAGDLFVSDFNLNGSITEITPGGVESTFATGLDEPRGLAFNSAGDLFAGTINNITEIEPGGLKLTFASGVTSLAFNSTGDLFAVSDAQNDGIIIEITPNGTLTTFATARVNSQQLAFNNQGILFVANPSAGGVLEFNSSGTQSTFVSGLGTVEGLAFQPVPEPSVIGLLGIGAIVIGLRRKAKNR